MTVPDPSRIAESDPLGELVRIDVLTPIIPLITPKEEPENPESNDPDIGDEPEGK